MKIDKQNEGVAMTDYEDDDGEDKTALLCITKEELNHLINDTISYIWKLENKGLIGDEYGYSSRKKLLEKLEQFEEQHFHEPNECCE